MSRPTSRKRTCLKFDLAELTSQVAETGEETGVVAEALAPSEPELDGGDAAAENAAPDGDPELVSDELLAGVDPGDKLMGVAADDDEESGEKPPT